MGGHVTALVATPLWRIHTPIPVSVTLHQQVSEPVDSPEHDSRAPTGARVLGTALAAANVFFH